MKRMPYRMRAGLAWRILRGDFHVIRWLTTSHRDQIITLENHEAVAQRRTTR